MYESLADQATESDWSEEEKRAWYQERPDDAEYYWVQRDLLRNGLTRKAKLTQLPPVREGDPLLWAIGLDGASPLKRPEAVQDQPLHVSLAYDDELTEDVKRQLQEEWGEEREVTLQFHRFGNGASGELSLKWDPVANSESVQKAHKMGYYGQDKRGAGVAVREIDGQGLPRRCSPGPVSRTAARGTRVRVAPPSLC